MALAAAMSVVRLGHIDLRSVGDIPRAEVVEPSLDAGLVGVGKR
jgi:hypothetical protein